MVTEQKTSTLGLEASAFSPIKQTESLRNSFKSEAVSNKVAGGFLIITGSYLLFKAASEVTKGHYAGALIVGYIGYKVFQKGTELFKN